MKMRKISGYAAAVLSLPLLTLASCGSKSDKAASAETQTQQTQESAAAPAAAELKSEKGLPVVVDFFATWCGPCRQFKPTFEAAEKRYEGKVEFRSIDVDQHPELAQQYGIQAIPTIVFLDKEGREVNRETGLLPADQLDAAITSLLK